MPHKKKTSEALRSKAKGRTDKFGQPLTKLGRANALASSKAYAKGKIKSAIKSNQKKKAARGK